MKEYLFIRYGTTPNQEVSRVMLTELTAQGTKPHLQLLPGVIITLFKSTLTESEMRGKLDRIDGILYDLVEKKSATSNSTSTAPNNTSTSGTPSKEQLERELNAALASEDYEKASQIRDKIAELFPESNESIITSLKDFRLMLENSNKECKNCQSTDLEELGPSDYSRNMVNDSPVDYSRKITYKCKKCGELNDN